jgi:hypothetical protein
MKTFNQFLTEARKEETHYSAEISIHPAQPIHVLLVRHTKAMPQKLMEKLYPEKEQDHLGGHMYKVLGEFHPSKLDHHTITKEFHEHLHKHGYYAYTNSHPLVMSPKEQHFKAAFKEKAFKGKGAKFERPHHDGGFGGKGTGKMGRFTALWSTKGSTHVFHNDNKRIPEASKDSHTTIINDQKVKHAASGEKDRWFIRQGEIKKLPKHGLMLPPEKPGGAPRRFGHDVEAYYAAKKKSVGGPRREVREWHNRQLKIQKRTGKVDPHHHEVMNWVKQNHPEYHPDHGKGED